MKFIEKETKYTYSFTQTEKLVLTGVLSVIYEKGEMDEVSKKFVKDMLDCFSD